MDSTLKIPSITLAIPSSKFHFIKFSVYSLRRSRDLIRKINGISNNGSVSPSASQKDESSSVGDMHRRSSLESLFCYDKTVPEERIEKPIGLALAEKFIGNNPRCADCEAKGAVLCATCSGSGLYVDSILESQGIIVKVRCLDQRCQYPDTSGTRCWCFLVCPTILHSTVRPSTFFLNHDRFLETPCCLRLWRYW